MGAPAIILGNPNGILRLPKAGLRNRDKWTQLDSDILAHFIQVQAQIQQSRWFKSDIRFTARGNKVLDHSFPDFEDFVFAAMYIRQLVAENDSLLDDAVTRYSRFVDCAIRPFWVKNELDGFNQILNDEPSMLACCTVRELFDAFLYGASLMHKSRNVGNRNRERFLEIYDKQPRHIVLYALNMSLKMLMNPVGLVALVIRRDYAHWLSDYSLPLPDTRWHQDLFEVNAAG
jgi:hypothetical protein